MSRPFKLEAVLTHRRYREDTARQRLAAAARELNAARETLARQEKMRADYGRALRQKQASSGSVMEFLMYTRYLDRLDEEVGRQRQRVQTLTAEKDTLRRDLMIRLKERKVIERLKERHQADVDQRERDREQKILSDMAISRYQHRN